MQRSAFASASLSALAVSALCASASAASPAASADVGRVYTMSNDAAGNEVLEFTRGVDGALEPGEAYATGGAGTGAGLGNQGGLVLTNDGRFLMTVNAGSGDVSVFRVGRRGLEHTALEGAGMNPLSIAVHGDLVYVLSAAGAVGGADGIRGFRLGNDGTLAPLAGSEHGLSGANVGPAQVGFSPDGDFLVVTEKGTSSIDVFTIGPDGTPTAMNNAPSSGMTPFGFAFNQRGVLIVSEAFGGDDLVAAVSSYRIRSDGSLDTISASVPDLQTAACWIAISQNGKHAYTTNTGTASVSGYAVGNRGELRLLDADGRTGTTGEGPIDMAFTQNGRYLYTLDSRSGTLSAFAYSHDGSLTALAGVSGLPAAANGLAAL